MDLDPETPSPLLLKTPIQFESKRRGTARLSEVVSTIITYRQKGIQTLIFHSLAILVSVTILFLLSQIYYIFLPCLKALLWALLCGSALYPFKIRLEAFLKRWLEDLNEKNRSFCFGCMLLPFQVIINVYCWSIQFILHHKILFLLFHFRFQMGEALKLLLHFLLPIFNWYKGIIPAFAIICITIQFIVILCTSQNFLQTILSLNFIPSILLMSFFYFSLNHFGIVGELILLFFMILFTIGLISTIYNLLHGSEEKKAIHEEFKTLINILSERLRTKIENGIASMRTKYALSPDSVDGEGMNLGKIFMALAFTVSAFAISEHMNLSKLILVILCIHIVLRKLFNVIKDKLSSLIELFVELFNSCWISFGDKLEKDALFKIIKHFFMQGDKIIKESLQRSLDLLTSISLFMIVAFGIIIFSVFLSVKIYGECYKAAYILQNEVKNIEFVQESINMTLNKITDADYLNNIIFNDKFNLRDDEKIFLNKMLFEFRNTILPYLNGSTSTTGRQINDSLPVASTGQIDSNEIPNHPNMLMNLSPSLLTMIDFRNFNQIITIISTQASSYLPVLKSFLSFSYAFIFVILDSSSFLLGFVVNFIVFAFALFYLLSSSHDKYKPIEFLDHIVGSLVTNQDENQFSHYVEEVINSIFAATIKISSFYGLYTWLVHSLFGLKICCIPAVIAAIFAAVPLLSAYWASLPACLYLYYFDPNLPLVKSVAMFSLAILPSFVVDSSIYSDIKKGGHPYLTGLAITCGVVYYGVEGALFGPLWLCLLFIILNMCTELDSDFLNNFTMAKTP